jgi:hypothetical protein
MTTKCIRLTIGMQEFQYGNAKTGRGQGDRGGNAPRRGGLSLSRGRLFAASEPAGFRAPELRGLGGCEARPEWEFRSRFCIRL